MAGAADRGAAASIEPTAIGDVQWARTLSGPTPLEPLPSLGVCLYSPLFETSLDQRAMSEDDDITEIASPPVMVAETNRIFRLSPAFDDLSQTSRQIALVPAESEEIARAIATAADALGRDWRDERAFIADSIETEERHVIGDVIFRSTPNAAPMKRRKRD
jgi:hypothetical protein